MPALPDSGQNFRKVTFARPSPPRAPSGHELIAHHVFYALDRESEASKRLLREAESASLARPSFPKPLSVYQPPKTKSSQGKTALKASPRSSRPASPGKSLRKSIITVHRPTPYFVQKLVRRYRADLHLHDHHAPSKPAERKSAKHKSLRLDRETVDAGTTGKKANLHKLSKKHLPYHSKSDLAEVEKIVKSMQKLRKVTMSTHGKNRIQTEKIECGNRIIHVPMLSYVQRAVAQKYKTSRNDPENLAGILHGNVAMEPQPDEPDVPEGLNDAAFELLAIVRRNRRMQEDGKWRTIERVRHLHREECKLALETEKLSQVANQIQAIGESMEASVRNNEQLSKNWEIQLRLSDEETISAIRTANDNKEERRRAQADLEKVEEQNNILLCHIIEKEEQIKMVDRLINVVYAATPDKDSELQDGGKWKTVTKTTKQAYYARPRFRKPLARMAEILTKHSTLSEQSEKELDVDEDFYHPDYESFGVPALPFTNLNEVIHNLHLLYEKSKQACQTVSELRHESRDLRRKVKVEMVQADSTKWKLLQECEKAEEEISLLRDQIENITADNEKYETGCFRRDEVRRPLNLLRCQIFRIYRRNFDTPEENMHKMVQRMHNTAAKVTEKFERVPLAIMQKCFKAADKDRLLETVFVLDSVKREEHDKRIQRYYYKSLDPPEIIWGRRSIHDDDPLSLDRKSAEFPPAYESEEVLDKSDRRTSVDIDRTNDWIMYRMREMSAAEFAELASNAERVMAENSLVLYKSSTSLVKVRRRTEPSSTPLQNPAAQRSSHGTEAMDQPNENNAESELVSSVVYAVLPENFPDALSVNGTSLAKEKDTVPSVPSYPDATPEQAEKDKKYAEFYRQYDKMMEEASDPPPKSIAGAADGIEEDPKQTDASEDTRKKSGSFGQSSFDKDDGNRSSSKKSRRRSRGSS